MIRLFGGGGGGGLPPGVTGDGHDGLIVNGGINQWGGSASWEIDEDGALVLGSFPTMRLHPDGRIDAAGLSLAADGTLLSSSLSYRINADGTAAFVGGVGVYGSFAPASQPVLATGAGHSPDDIIAFLQSFGFCKQS